MTRTLALPDKVDTVDHLSNLRRLLLARWGVLFLMAALCLLASPALDIPLPKTPLLGILAVASLFNLLIHVRYRSAESATPEDFFRQLLIDIATLSALIFFSGGATNPLVSLLLPPVAIAALTLPRRYVAIIVGTAIAAYSALLVFYLPLPLADPVRATRLHLTGMWLTFAVSAAMIAWFILHMTNRIRQRDAELSAAREQGLRDERVLAIGTLAAGAAHELGTPLGTMMLIAGELANDVDLPATAKEDVALLHQQIGICKEIITGLAERAGVERLENRPIQAVDRWIEQIRQRWQAIRPQTHSILQLRRQGKAPDLIIDPRLEQALLNLLNNAAKATNGPAGQIEIAIDWDERQIIIEVGDNGPGFPAGVLESAGSKRFPAHANGEGIGLLLTSASIGQLGGQLTLINKPAGGALARITLPRLVR